MSRHFLQLGALRLSYVDFGGPGRPLVALHGHFGCARNFAPLAAALAPERRVIALDQRGHGWSGHPDSATREDYVADALALLRHLDLGPVPVLGHSLGGCNAYQLAARHPERVSALVVEDIGARIGLGAKLGRSWPKRFPSCDAVLAHLAASGLDGDRHFLDSLAEFEDGWGFRFDPDWMDLSRHAIRGDWTADWVAVSCPTLLLHGTRSWAVTAPEIERMRRLRPDTDYAEFDCGHTMHDEMPDAFAAAVRSFLDRAGV